MDPERLARAALIVLSLANGAGCTTFAGESLADDTEADAAASSAATTGGGVGGATPNDPDAYLPLLDAAELCALVSDCGLLGPSIVASIGVPIVAVDLEAQSVDVSYSACLDWLSSPLRAGRVGFEAQQELLYGVLPSGCAAAIAYLPFQAVPAADERCAGAPLPYCDGDTLIDCAAGLAVACSSPSFSPATSCLEIEGATARCGIPTDCTEPPAICDGTYAVTCADDVLTAFDCATIGLGCSGGACAGASGAETCAEASIGDESCSSDGEKASVCLGGYVGETDCDAAGLACIAEGPRRRCGDPAAACGPYDTGIDVCRADDVLHTCASGVPIDLDCKALGRKCLPARSFLGLSLSGRCALVEL